MGCHHHLNNRSAGRPSPQHVRSERRVGHLNHTAAFAAAAGRDAPPPGGSGQTCLLNFNVLNFSGIWMLAVGVFLLAGCHSSKLTTQTPAAAIVWPSAPDIPR